MTKINNILYYKKNCGLKTMEKKNITSIPLSLTDPSDIMAAFLSFAEIAVQLRLAHSSAPIDCRPRRRTSWLGCRECRRQWWRGVFSAFRSNHRAWAQLRRAARHLEVSSEITKWTLSVTAGTHRRRFYNYLFI